MAKPTSKPIYNSKRWQELRAMKLLTAPWCEWCTSAGILRVAANVVDHRIPIEQGGPAYPDLDGLASMCVECHNSKTRAEQLGRPIKTAERRPRRVRIGPDGYPIE